MLRIVEIINEKGITNVALAKMLSVSPQYVSEVINGHRNITIDTAKKFADALEEPVAAIFDGYKSAPTGDTLTCPYCGKPIKFSKLAKSNK